MIARKEGARGRLPDARIRRCISTVYYALFHFLLDEAGHRLVGSDHFLRSRRRMLARSFSHSGIRATFNKLIGHNVDQSVEDFLRGRGAAGRVPTPVFVRSFARTFLDAYAKREGADYDRNESLSLTDATILLQRADDVMRAWKAANSAPERDFKHALYILMLLKGQLKRDA